MRFSCRLVVHVAGMPLPETKQLKIFLLELPAAALIVGRSCSVGSVMFQLKTIWELKRSLTWHRTLPHMPPWDRRWLEWNVKLIWPTVKRTSLGISGNGGGCCDKERSEVLRERFRLCPTFVIKNWSQVRDFRWPKIGKVWTRRLCVKSVGLLLIPKQSGEEWEGGGVVGDTCRMYR